MTNLIFDYDGTLHESIKIYAPAFRKAQKYLVSEGLTEEKDWAEDEISKWLGYNSDDMWNMFMPLLPRDIKDECSGMIGNEMIRLTQAGAARLYPNADIVLDCLKDKGYNLILLSNCKRRYMEAHVKHFNLDRYFAAFYCSEDFMFIPKHEIFNEVRLNHFGEYVVIGDRFHDMEIAQKHKLKSIGCSYGYGEKREISKASTIITKIEEIIPALANLQVVSNER